MYVLLYGCSVTPVDPTDLILVLQPAGMAITGILLLSEFPEFSMNSLEQLR